MCVWICTWQAYLGALGSQQMESDSPRAGVLGGCELNHLLLVLGIQHRSWGRKSTLGCSPTKWQLWTGNNVGGSDYEKWISLILSSLFHLIPPHHKLSILTQWKELGGLRIIWTIEVNLYSVNYPVIFKNCLFDYVSIRGLFKAVGAGRLHTHGNQWPLAQAVRGHSLYSGFGVDYFEYFSTGSLQICKDSEWPFPSLGWRLRYLSSSKPQGSESSSNAASPEMAGSALQLNPSCESIKRVAMEFTFFIGHRLFFSWNKRCRSQFEDTLMAIQSVPNGSHQVQEETLPGFKKIR